MIIYYSFFFDSATRKKPKKTTTLPAGVAEKNEKIPNSKPNTNKFINSPEPPKPEENSKTSEPQIPKTSPKATNSAAAGKMKLPENIPPVETGDKVLTPPITRHQEKSAQSPVRPQTSTPLQKQNSKDVMSEDEFVLSDTEMNPPSWETGSNSSLNRMFADLSDEGMASGEEGSADVMNFSFSPPGETSTNAGQKKNDGFDFFGDADNSNEKSANSGLFDDEKDDDGGHFSLF
jgi:hypothetical protein